MNPSRISVISSTSSLLTVKLRFLEDLDLADVDIVEWVKVRAGLLNVLGDAVGDAENKHTRTSLTCHKLCGNSIICSSWFITYQCSVSFFRTGSFLITYFLDFEENNQIFSFPSSRTWLMCKCHCKLPFMTQ